MNTLTRQMKSLKSRTTAHSQRTQHLGRERAQQLRLAKRAYDQHLTTVTRLQESIEREEQGLLASMRTIQQLEGC